MKKITVIGSLNMDLVICTPRMPVMGETIIGSGFMTVPGGKGANQAVAAARLGGNVSMIGCVGGDIFGSRLIENLKDNNVDTANVAVIEECATGIAVILVKDGDNCIVIDQGANYKLMPETLEQLEEIIKDSFMVVVQLEIPIPTVYKAIEIARRHGIKVLLNPAPACQLDDSMLSQVDILVPNESECELITGISIKSVEDGKVAVKYLMDKGVPQVVVTLGSRGVLYNSGKDIVHKPALDVKAVDTTAAGDSFCGALAVAFSEGRGIDEAISFANLVGALTVQKKGAQSSLPTREEAEIFRRKLEQSY